MQTILHFMPSNVKLAFAMDDHPLMMGDIMENLHEGDYRDEYVEKRSSKDKKKREWDDSDDDFMTDAKRLWNSACHSIRRKYNELMNAVEESNTCRDDECSECSK